MRPEPPSSEDSDEEAQLEEMSGLVDILRELVHQHLPGEIDTFETLLVDFATFWSHGDAVRRVLHASWKVLPVASRRREARFIAEAAALGRCTATEARALIELDYGGAKEWRVRRALRRASIQRAEARQFDGGKDLLDRLPSNVWTPRTSRARELWITARHQAAAGRAAATALDQLAGLLQAADPQHGWSVELLAHRACRERACTAEERDQVIKFCRRWAGSTVKS